MVGYDSVAEKGNLMSLIWEENLILVIVKWKTKPGDKNQGTTPCPEAKQELSRCLLLLQAPRAQQPLEVISPLTSLLSPTDVWRIFFFHSVKNSHPTRKSGWHYLVFFSTFKRFWSPLPDANNTKPAHSCTPQSDVSFQDNFDSLRGIRGLLSPPYQIDNVHPWLPLSELGGIWMRRRRRRKMMLRLELQLELASEVWIPSVMLDQPLEKKI